MWPLFGIDNQMLAAIALILASVVLIKKKCERYVWVTLIPTVWLMICTLTAGWQKAFSSNPKLGFLAHANLYQQALQKGELLAPAQQVSQMRQILFNDYVDAILTIGFSGVLVFLFIWGLILAYRLFNGYLPPDNVMREKPINSPARCC